MTDVSAPVDLRATVVEELTRARERTLRLLAAFGDADLTSQVSPLMSPLVWDLAHIAHYEELWLLREVSGAVPTDPCFDDLYDAFKHPRRERSELDILGPTDARAFAADVRERVLEHLSTVDLDGDDPLLHDAFVYGMVIQHEHQHVETMLATVNLMDSPSPVLDAYREPALRAPDTHPGTRPDFVDVPGGEVVLGTATEPWAYDNERPAHGSRLSPYRIASSPVTNAEHAAFIADGGYTDERLWTAAGWAWRQEADLEHPMGWQREGDDGWSHRHFGRTDELPPGEPVQHVCWYEADAHARWAGARLPSESEWEAAARAHHIGNTGQVWEWTASDFTAYPGFRSFPYREYSEVFFGDEYKVLRGGSWATDPVACRTTFRNWDYPIRRQIFSGFRLAGDA